jgi:hypothetical protein
MIKILFTLTSHNIILFRAHSLFSLISREDYATVAKEKSVKLSWMAQYATPFY